jgi:hypothetical protein
MSRADSVLKNYNQYRELARKGVSVFEEGAVMMDAHQTAAYLARLMAEAAAAQEYEDQTDDGIAAG